MLKDLVLHSIKTHYQNGHYLLYIPEKNVINGDYIQKYERYAGGYVYELNQTIRLFDLDIPVKVHKPFGQTHRYEYEYYFNFGPHCEKYDNNKTVIQCLRNPILNNDKLEEILDTLTNEHNTDKIIELLLLLILGGFVNNMDCIDELSNSLSNTNINRDNLFKYLLEHIENK
jgi:hypothetical protein